MSPEAEGGYEKESEGGGKGKIPPYMFPGARFSDADLELNLRMLLFFGASIARCCFLLEYYQIQMKRKKGFLRENFTENKKEAVIFLIRDQ